MSKPNGDGLLSRFLGKLLVIFFHLLYNQFAWTYDFVADIVSLGRWKSWVLSLIPYLENSEILELGHGTGHLQITLHELGFSPIGIDASPHMVRIAATRLKRKGFPLQIALGNSQHLPYPNQHFRYIVATFPSEYIFDPMTVQEVWRVLDGGGELVVLAVAWLTGEKWLDRIAAWLFRITGQAPETLSVDFMDRFRRQTDAAMVRGFQFNTEYIELQDSKLMLVRAKKSAAVSL